MNKHFILFLFLFFYFFTQHTFWISSEVVIQHCLVVIWLVPRKTAVVSAHILCTPESHAPVYSAIFKATYDAFLAATWHLHLWQYAQGLLHATAVTQRYRHKNQHRKLTTKTKTLPPLLPGLEPATFRSRARALTTELFPLPSLPAVLFCATASVTISYVLRASVKAARFTC